MTTFVTSELSEHDQGPAEPYGLWHASAPRRVRGAYRSGDAAAGWSAWAKHLARRRHPREFSRLVGGRCSPLAWALPARVGELDSADLIDRIGSWHRLGKWRRKKLANEAAQWLSSA